MQKLIDLLNLLSEKYKFDEADRKRVQEVIFELESKGDESVSPDMAAEDFVPGEIEEAYGKDD